MKISVILTLIFCLSTSVFAYQADVENISNRDYFQTALNAINNAKESIVMGMYIISLPSGNGGGKVRQLLEGLVNAKKRGVTVKVILEYHGLEDFTPSGIRYYAYNYLKNNGIEVYFDEYSTNCLHLKTIVIDKEIVITGSSNWSEAAFTSNYETNLIARSKPLALEVLKDLDEIPLRNEPPAGIKDSFYIPVSFCDSESGGLREMVRQDDLRAMDLILILWNENKNIISCSFIAEELGIIDVMDRTGWRRQIKKTLKKLEEKYKLIRYKWQFGIDEVGIELLSYPGDAPVKFPRDYFRYGWNKRLSLSSKAVLITMYAELGELGRSIINGPILYLSKKYGIKVDTYSKGIQELKRYNIIKVQYAKGFKNRDDTKISIMGFYDMEDYNKKIETLKVQYGEELVVEVQGLAGVVYSAYDYDIIKDILEKIEIYGIGPVREAFGYTKKMRVDNYKRTYNYVVNILKREY